MKKLLLLCLGLCALCAEPKVLIFGDSNTFGTTDNQGGAHDEHKLYWAIASKALNKKADIRVNALPGRTIGLDFPSEHFNGFKALKETLRAERADILVVMLGTNDLLIGAKPDMAAEAFSNFITYAKKQGIKGLLIIAPPLLDFGDEKGAEVLKSYSLAFNDELRKIANENNAFFIDAIKIIGKAKEKDGVHLSQEDHAKLAPAVANWLNEILKKY